MITGYLWFAVAWVAINSVGGVPDLDRPFSRYVESLLSLGGTTVYLGALSFAAYIVGGLLSVRSIGPGSRNDSVGTKRKLVSYVLLVNVPVTLTRFFRDLARRSGSSNLRTWAASQVRRMPLPPSSAAAIEADRQLPDELRAAMLAVVADDVGDTRQHLATAIAGWVEKDEVGALRVRLRLEREALFQDHDRLVSESELRCSIYLPLAVLAVEAAVLQHLWALAALPLSVMLLMDGLNLDKQSREILYEALVTEAIASPTMDRIHELAGTSEDRVTAPTQGPWSTRLLGWTGLL